jgi:RimJ/RimL family protein N-acetyltransferase
MWDGIIKAMDPLAYLHLQMRLEGKELVSGCLMRQVETVPGEEMPLLPVAQLASAEIVVYYDENAPPELQRNLAAGVPGLKFPQIDALLTVLKTQTIRVEVEYYKTYVFPSQPVQDEEVTRLSRQDSRVTALGFGGFSENVFAVERDSALVSACVSTRENAECGEAWVYTAPEFRHRGLAQKAVNAWARSLMAAGKVPFYSHKIENEASANLARKLALQPVFEEIVISRAL